MANPFGYQVQKFSEARSSLMLPCYESEARSFADAFAAITHAFYQFQEIKLITGEETLDQIATVKRLMDTSGVEDPTGEGTFLHRARAMTVEEKREFASAVDSLADYFLISFWQGSPFE